MRNFFTAKLSATLGLLMMTVALSSCGRSVLFYKRQAPNAPSLNANNARNGALQPQVFTFVAKNEANLEDRGGALALIFGSGAVDPFEANNSKQSVLVEMLVRSEEIDEVNFENFVKARFTISARSGDKVIASRIFESEALVSLKNNDAEDLMTGTFTDSERKGIRLSVSARRAASGTEELAVRNAWNGTLNLIEDDNRLTELGTLSGFFSGLLTE